MSRIVNATRQSNVADRAQFATSAWGRFRGLMLRRSGAFGMGQALVIDPCTSIHMFCMRFPIDVLYVDRENRVVRAQARIKPWRVGPLYTRGARFVIELPAGAIEASGTQVGDHLVLEAPAG